MTVMSLPAQDPRTALHFRVNPGHAVWLDLHDPRFQQKMQDLRMDLHLLHQAMQAGGHRADELQLLRTVSGSTSFYPYDHSRSDSLQPGGTWFRPYLDADGTPELMTMLEDSQAVCAERAAFDVIACLYLLCSDSLFQHSSMTLLYAYSYTADSNSHASGLAVLPGIAVADTVVFTGGQIYPVKNAQWTGKDQLWTIRTLHPVERAVMTEKLKYLE